LDPRHTPILSVSYDAMRGSGWKTDWFSLRTDWRVGATLLGIPIVLTIAISYFLGKSVGPIPMSGRLALALILIVGWILFNTFATYFKLFPRADTVRHYIVTLRKGGVAYTTPDKTVFLPWGAIRDIRRESRAVYFQSDSEELIRHNMILIAVLESAFADVASAARFQEAAVTLWKSNGAKLPPTEVTAEFPVLEPSPQNR
jgi:hypothetical protein